jgi:aminoacyl tRNA synthase complex-interacting multifunctional protein 1
LTNVISLVVSDTQPEAELVLADGTRYVGSNTIAIHFATLHSPVLAPTAALPLALMHQFLSSSAVVPLPLDAVGHLNEHLLNRTFIVENDLTVTDMVVWARVYPVIHEWKTRGWKGVKSWDVVRWFLHIQALVKDSVGEISALKEEIQVDVDSKVVQEHAKSARGVVDVKKKKDKAVATEEAVPVEEKKKEKKEKVAKPKEPKEPESTVILPSQLDMRVGFIRECKRHEAADSLYVEQIDVGEEQPRTVVSGLVKYIPLEQMQERKVVLLCNLKPANMRGVKSHAMVLCATSPDGNTVEFVEPPPTASPGDRVVFEHYEDGAFDAVLNPKKKVWETIQPGLLTNDDRVAGWLNPNNQTWCPMKVKGSTACTVATVTKGTIK